MSLNTFMLPMADHSIPGRICTLDVRGFPDNYSTRTGERKPLKLGESRKEKIKNRTFQCILWGTGSDFYDSDGVPVITGKKGREGDWRLITENQNGAGSDSFCNQRKFEHFATKNWQNKRLQVRCFTKI